MSDTNLVCEGCLDKCVPAYVRNKPDDPVLCIACRMSKTRKDNPEMFKDPVTPISIQIDRFTKYLDDTYDFKEIDGDVIYEDDMEINELIKNFKYAEVSRILERATIMVIAKQKSDNKNPDRLRYTVKYSNIQVFYINNMFVKMHEIKPSMEGKKIKFNSIINGVSDKKTYYTNAVFICKKCDNIKTEEPDDLYQIYIPRCENCRIDMTLDKEASTTEAIRRVVLEEPMEEAINSNPQRYMGIITGGDVHEVAVGQRKKITGIFRSVIKDTRNKMLGENDVVIVIKQIEDMSETRETMPTKEAIEKYMEESKSPDFITKIVGSFTDKIGLYDEKLALLLSLVKGSKTEVVNRDDIHVLLMGNPSVAKSELLKEAHLVTPKSMSTSGENVSKVGLRGGIEQTDGYPIFIPGALSRASGSHLIIDELDKVSNDDKGALHQSMEQQIIEYDKIIHIKLPADTGILAGANPKMGYYDDDLNLQQNFNLPFTLQTRFDLIFFIKSIEDETTITKISKQATKADYKFEPYMNREQLSAYLNYCRTIDPKFTDEAGNLIQKFWIVAKMHSLKLKNGQGIKIEPRHLHGLIRLTFAFAKLQLHDTVTIQDAESAIGIFKRSLLTLGQDVETGELHQGVLTPTPQENKQSAWLRIVNELSEKSADGVIDPIDLIDMMIKSGKFDEYNAKEWITKDASKGTTIINTWNNKYKLSK